MSSLEPDYKFQSKIKKLSDGIPYIYEHGIFCDCEFEVKTEIFPAHKLVLSSRSSVFAALLMDRNAAKTNIIDKESVTVNGFRILLRFIYTDKIDTEDKKSIVEAYLAADHFQQLSLKHLCEEKMNEWFISEDEVCELLNASLQVPVLKDRCLLFIKENAEKVISSENFLKLKLNCLSLLLEKDILRDVPLVFRIERIMEWGGRDHTKPVNYKLVREDFLSCKPPLLPMLGLESLTMDDFGKLFTVKYNGLLEGNEVLQFIQYFSSNGQTKLPDWKQD